MVLTLDNKHTNIFYSILFTVDVEDWFQVENFKPWIPFSSWPSYELRVEKNIHRLLDILDSCDVIKTDKNKSFQKPQATFFMLAWLAARRPNLVREIYNRGHEIASHGYRHQLCTQQSKDSLKKDLIDSKKLLEDTIGTPVYGYRAPSFSINHSVLQTVRECGYSYDSSYNSFALHGRYGKMNLSKNGKKEIAVKIADNFYELPISNFKMGRYIIPLGGGGYFRLIPFPFFKAGVRKVLKKDKAYLIYIHPWEIDPKQPKVEDASAFYKFRHYYNLKNTDSKLAAFMATFRKYRFMTCHQYINKIIRTYED